MTSTELKKLGVDRVDTACEKVARMSPCVDSKCPNYWDDAYDDLKPGDIETDCEPAPQEVVKHQAPAPRAEKTHVLVPLRMTKAMREVVDVEDWSWAELLAAAEAVTEDEHAIAEQASGVQQEPVAWVDERVIQWLADRPSSASSNITTKLAAAKSPERPMPLYTHPAPHGGTHGR